MKAKDLIERLSRLDPELEVVVLADDHWCYDISGNVRTGYVREGRELDPNETATTIEDRVAILSCLT